MSTKIGSLYAEIGAKTSGLERGLASARALLTKTSRSFRSFATNAKVGDAATRDMGDSMLFIGKSSKDAATALDKTGGATKNVIQQFKALKVGGLAAMAAVAGAIAAFKKVLEFSKEAAQFARLEESSSAMARSIGLDMEDVMMSVRASSKGMVSDADIMASSTRAMMLGVGSSASEMAQLMEVAAVRGRAMGLSATQAFNDLVTGIGRQSRMILDNLGIILDLDKVYEDYAATLGVTAKSLTVYQQKEAMTQAVIKDTQGLLKETGGLVVDAAGHWEKLDAAEANWAVASKRRALAAGTGWAKFWAAQFEDSTRYMELQSYIGAAVDADIISLAESKHGLLGLTLEELEELYKRIKPELDAYAEGQKVAAKAVGENFESTSDYAEALAAQTEATKDATAAQSGLTKTVGFAEKALRDQNAGLEHNIWLQDQLALMSGKITPAQIELRKIIETLTGALADGNITRYEYIEGLKMLTEEGMILGESMSASGAAIRLLSEALRGMPHEVRTKVLIEYGYTTVGGGQPGADFVIPMGGIPGGGGSSGGNWVKAGPNTTPGMTGGWWMNTDTGAYEERDMGGPVVAGRPYLIGRPEIFVPETSGEIIPIGGASSEGFGNNVTIEEGAIQIFTQGEGVDAYELLETLTEEIGRR